MKQNQLGRTDLHVSELCLGTMTWGEQNTQADAFEQMDYALERGINFFDTAELYPVPPKAETAGSTETIIGNWFAERKNRDSVILASKVVGASDWLPHFRDGKAKLDKANITAALDASLKRLQTDYIDLYQLHWPDRSTNYFGQLGYTFSDGQAEDAIGETLLALQSFVTEGKIRHIGLSNETPWGIHKFLSEAEKTGAARVASIQNPYNLLNRTFEVGCAEFAHREQVGLLAYSPMAFGALSGKYLNNQKPANARMTLFDRFTRYLNERGVNGTQAYVDLAKRHGLDPAQMSLAFVTTRPFVTSNIIGATTMTQLTANIDSANISLNADILDEIEQIHQENPNPCP